MESYRSYDSLHKLLQRIIPPGRLYTDPLKTLAWGTDASFYRLIPKIVVIAENEEEITQVLKHAGAFATPITFRAAGTSLSGQAISDSILIVASDHWKGYEVLDEGKRIRLQPGIVGSRANIILAPYGRKIGPDPASINACMIGGIAANNASGMCCGTAENSYQTMHSMRIIFHDGTLLDTASSESRKAFAEKHGKMLGQISDLCKSVNEDTELVQRIRQKFKMKNTTGYSINALIDFSDPIDVISHLMIGSEGTLGFIAEITYTTVLEHRYKASSLMIFPDIAKACLATTVLKNEPVAAVEIIDRAGLRSVENNPGMPDYLKGLQSSCAALLVETRASEKDELQRNIEKIKLGLLGIPITLPINFTDVPAEYNKLWNIRKGLFPSVGAMRKTGTTCIIEDVAFPLETLASATIDLQHLFEKFGYSEAVIFGHALEGNLHFVFNQDFGTSAEVERYGHFMDELVKLVVDKFDGSLKAEHGTGRNMAPFVEKEWGTRAFEIMKQIKEIFDPYGLLNPGVIFNDSRTAHLENLKPLPAVHELVDKCIECGFCEPVCVSSDLTLSPRQRIVVLREQKRLLESGREPHMIAALSRTLDYDVDKTCATDGLCALNCPVKIDTGSMVKVLREQNNKGFKRNIAFWIADHMGFVVKSTSFLLTLVWYFHKILGTRIMQGISSGARWLSGGTIPKWNPYFPRGSRTLPKVSQNHQNPLKVVYFPSCINRAMGISVDYSEKMPVADKMIALLKKAGYEVIIPHGVEELCCGMSFMSKGYTEHGIKKSEELRVALLNASEGGRIPILCVMSPCLFTMKTQEWPDMKLYEPVEFILEFLTDKLIFQKTSDIIAIFAVCSAKKMGLEDSLVRLARMCSENVRVLDANCCGFAGDRGFTVPELNEHGLRSIKDQLHGCQEGFSSSRTCEIGLTLHGGVSFKSIVYLVDKVTSPVFHDQK